MHKRIIKGMVMLMTVCLALTAEAGKLPKVTLPQEVTNSFA
jgi:hypothetical protein